MNDSEKALIKQAVGLISQCIADMTARQDGLEPIEQDSLQVEIDRLSAALEVLPEVT